MAKPRNSAERLAAEAAERLDTARAMGEQLSMLVDEDGRTAVEAGSGKVGRPKGAKNKGSNQMRDWLAAKGYRMPEDVLAEMAGLASTDGAILTAMRHADQVLTWAFAGAAGGDAPGPAERVSMFMQLYAAQLRAADALLPYGAPKATPDVVTQTAIQIVTPAPRPEPRDVTPQPSRMRSRMVPQDVAWENEQKQEVSNPENAKSDDESRTE